MKYIKLFNQHTDYTTYKASANYVTPNVSYCKDQNECHFEKYYDPYNGHEYVDLGLPSGTLWAKCNVGASSETDYGKYFAWGDTQGYTSSQVGTDKNFAWADYKYGTYDSSDTTNYGMTKYNGTDGKTTLDLDDDAAHVNMGGEWKMPTSTQIEELLNTTYVTNAYTQNYNGSGIDGYLFTSVDNGNTLFVPFAGSAFYGSVLSTGFEGFVWSSSLFSSNVYFAFYLYVNGEPDAVLDNRDRCIGRSVRGVVQN